MAVTDVTAVAFSLLALVLLQRAAGRSSPAREEGDGEGLDHVAASPAAERRAARWLVLGAVAAGLATSTKYNLGMLVLPATVAAVFACRPAVGAARRRRRPRRPCLAAAVDHAGVPADGGRLPASRSPFVLLDAPHFLRDFRRQSQIMDRGWLGFEHVGNGFWYNVDAQPDGRDRRRARGARRRRPGLGVLAPHAAGPHGRALRRRLLPVHRNVEGARRPLPAGDRAAGHPLRRASLRRCSSASQDRGSGGWRSPRSWSCSPWPSCSLSRRRSPSTAT